MLEANRVKYVTISAMNKPDKEHYLINTLGSKYIGDDGAVIGEMVYSMDAFHEDMHFRRTWMTPAQIARKAMLINLSDAIAMNAVPQYALITISLPREISEAEIRELTQSFEATAKAHGCEIIGGDTIGGEKLHISITIISQSDDPLLRSGLKEGDLLAYTGVLGESKRDLDRLLNGENIAEDSRFYEPKLRKEFVAKSRAYLRAGMDISDGLYCDTNKILDYNALGFEPIIDISDEIGSSGEEYEMLVGFAPEILEKVMEVAKETKTLLTVFARVAENERRFSCRSHHFQGDNDCLER
ncbi:MAG: thiamine-phosphate kinase [Campylobacterota bacterium]|nr:thiamine-phosphate kinase [Campylobacterota bacterium]